MNICLVYNYSQLEDGSIDPQTEKRCSIALGLYRQFRVQKMVITVAGGKNGVLSGEAMRMYFVKNGVKETDIYFEPLATNTAMETDAAIGLLERKLPGQSYYIVPVTTWYHAPRVMLLWLVRGYMVNVYYSYARAKWVDVRNEPVKFVKTIIFILRNSRSLCWGH